MFFALSFSPHFSFSELISLNKIPIYNVESPSRGQELLLLKILVSFISMFLLFHLLWNHSLGCHSTLASCNMHYRALEAHWSNGRTVTASKIKIRSSAKPPSQMRCCHYG